MSWFKFDDNAVDHPKVATLSNLAFRWWVRGFSYASRFLTDGLLPPIFWKQVPKQSRAEISGNGLWDWSDPNFEIHDYAKYQSSKDDVEYQRDRNREKNKTYRDKKRSSVTAKPVTGDRSVTEPENREQRSENREQIQRSEKGEGASRLTPLIPRGEAAKWGNKHGSHVSGFCGWCCLTQEQADEFAAKIPGDDLTLKRSQVREWALAMKAVWVERIIPDGSNFDFWRNRWTETHGGSKPANATLKAARVAADIDEAFR